MPEGDSIHWLAEKIRRAALHKTVRAFSARDIADALGATVVGRVVAEVSARGKNLLIVLDDGRAIHIHLRMLGRVTVHAPRDAGARGSGTKRPSSSQLVIEVDGATIRGNRIPVLRLLRKGTMSRAPGLSDLGPDLLGASFDERLALGRLRALADKAIGEAILDQRALAGIGNIYKSEVLFLEKIDPRATVASLTDRALLDIMRRARTLLARNVRRGPRVTRPSLAGPRTWVYLRARKACFSCGAAIVRIRQGKPPGRSTYYCPRCQGE